MENDWKKEIKQRIFKHKERFYEINETLRRLMLELSMEERIEANSESLDKDNFKLVWKVTIAETSFEIIEQEIKQAENPGEYSLAGSDKSPRSLREALIHLIKNKFPW